MIPRDPRDRKTFSRFVPGLLLSLLVLGCGKEEDGAAGNAEAQTMTKNPPVPVAVSVLQNGNVEDAVQAWGTIRPEQEAEILSELSGRVSSVQAALGDKVRKGDILLEIDPDLYVTRVEEAESRLESARIAMERSQKDLERKEALFSKGNVSDSEIEGARSQTAQAVSDFSAAKASLAQTRKDLAGARLRAPFKGHVASRPPDVGSTVSPGMALVSVVAIDKVRVETLLSEQDLAKARPGSRASIRIDAFPDREFPGTVLAIGPQTDPATKQFPVEIEVENPSGHPLRGGMVARVTIEYKNYENVPLLPVDALVEDKDGPAVFTVANGVAHRRPLTPGPRQGQQIGILAGVAAGDTVVVLGQVRLSDGSEVVVEEIR